MPASRETIKREVEVVLCAVAQTTTDKFTEASALNGYPFWFTAQMKSALCVPFTNISLRHGGSPIAPSESGACATVQDCIDLTHRKANAAPSHAARLSAKFTNRPRDQWGIA